MKLLFCEICGDIVSPARKAKEPRFCSCGGAALFWDDPETGRLAVWAKKGKQSVSVLGLHNGLLYEPFSRHGPENALEFGCIQKDRIRAILDATEGSYVFKQVDSLVIRCRPGYSGDVRMVSEEELRGLSEPDPMLALAAARNPKHGESSRG